MKLYIPNLSANFDVSEYNCSQATKYCLKRKMPIHILDQNGEIVLTAKKRMDYYFQIEPTEKSFTTAEI